MKQLNTNQDLYIGSILLLVMLMGSLTQAWGQEYAYNGYKDQVVGEVYAMPGDSVTDTTALIITGNGFVTPWDYDRAGLNVIAVDDSSAFTDFQADSGAVFGINGIHADAGGQEKRGYVSKKLPEGRGPQTAPIRWNGGWNGWRRTGKWCNYTLNFAEGNYQLVYRARIDQGGSHSIHHLRATIVNTSNIADTISDFYIDLRDDTVAGGAKTIAADFAPGDTIDNILYIGGSDGTSAYLKALPVINIPASGDYVFRFEEIIDGVGLIANFTFNNAAPDTTTALQPLLDENLVKAFHIHDNTLQVEFTQAQLGEIYIVDLLGKAVFEEKIQGMSYKRQLNLKNGIYVAYIKLESGYISKKIPIRR